MRIGIDARSIGPLEAGPGIYARQLVEQMSRMVTDWTFFLYLGDAASKVGLPEGPNIRARELRRPGGRKLGNLLFEQLFLPAAVRKDGCDLLWSPAFVLPLWKTTPQVVTMHDIIPLIFPREETLARRLVYHRLLRLNSRQADRVITVSHSSARDLVEGLGVDPVRIEVAQNGLEKGFAPLQERDREPLRVLLEKLGVREPYVLFTAGLLPRKNAHGVLDAFARVASSDGGRGPCSLVLTGKTTGGGKEPYVARLRETARRLGIEDRVHFVGYRSRRDVRLLYGGALLSVDPSFYEGFGFPVLESMACGCPVITSRVSSLPEVAGDAALLVDPRCVEELAEAMNRLTTDRSLRHLLREKGVRRARRFSWEESAQRMLDVFRQVVEGHVPRKEVAA